MFKDVVDSYVIKCLVKIRWYLFLWMNSEICKVMNKWYKFLNFCDGMLNIK